MRIVELVSENFKRIKIAEVRPSGPVVEIVGRNASGKTSLLDSIAAVIGGKSLICDQPVRKGAKQARLTCDLGDIVATRTITADGGGSLKVTAKDGTALQSPQAVMDKLLGKLSFDPLEFVRMKPAQQVETLRSLLGLDFAAADGDRLLAFTRRTEANRLAAATKARLDAMPFHDGVPAEEVSATEIMGDIEAANELNAKVDRHERALSLAEQNVANCSGLVSRLKQELATAEKNLIAAESEVDHHKRAVASIRRIDTAPIKAKLAASEDTNRKVRNNNARRELAKQHKDQEAAALQLTRKIESLDEAKQAALSSAKYPIDGLAFGDGLLTFNGIPFSQSSSAEQLRVSVAIGIAMNPKLRVILIRDGSLLDDDGMKMIAEMAAKAEAQIWVEKVSNGPGGTGIYIEDGTVKPAETAPMPEGIFQ